MDRNVFAADGRTTPASFLEQEEVGKASRPTCIVGFCRSCVDLAGELGARGQRTLGLDSAPAMSFAVQHER